jgi:hypothetical protein
MQTQKEPEARQGNINVDKDLVIKQSNLSRFSSF